MGPAHVISISTEFYFYVNYGIIQVIKQYEWLERDLKVIIQVNVVFHPVNNIQLCPS